MKRIATGLLFIVYLHCAYAELHDPTRPASYTQNQNDAGASTLALNLTLVSPDRRVAVINGLPLKIGDKIDSNRIISIESNSVQLTGPGGNIMLFPLDKSVKQAAQSLP